MIIGSVDKTAETQAKLIIDITLAAIVKRNGNLLLYVKQFEPIIIANIGQIVFIAIKPLISFSNVELIFA